MSIIIFDVEADGFVAEATQIHIIVTKDYDTGKVSHFYDNEDLAKNDFVYYAGTIKQGLRHILDYDSGVCHNYVGYDLPLILKLYPNFKKYLGVSDTQYCTESGKILDSLILSRMMDPDRKGHSVDHYGSQLPYRR